MPNWTLTSYRIEGDKKDLKKIYDTLVSSSTEYNLCDGSSSDWEGNILVALGAKEEDLKGRSIRGFILDYDLFGNTLRIEAQEAWDRTDFSEMLSELMPELSIYYRVEEPGMEIYYTNDIHGDHFPENFYVDYYVGDCMGSEYFIDENEMYDYIGEILGRDDVNAEVIEQWDKEKTNQDDYIYIYKFKR